MKSQTIAFEPFGTYEGVLQGAPIKIMPLGVFFRGQRKIEITTADLQQVAANLKAGLPRFRVPINENHAGSGKIGTVYDVAFDPSGADGPGLYATKYELTDTGKKLVADKRFDAVSPEMVWSKNGAKYQDPQTGKEHDNVLVGLALTERPFFGHDNVALFSDKPEATMAEPSPLMKKWQKFRDMMAQALKMMDDPEEIEVEIKPGSEEEPPADKAGAEPEVDGFKDYNTEQRKEMAKKGWALPDGSYPIADGEDLSNAITAIGRASNPGAAKAHIIKRAKALGLTDKLPPDWVGSEKTTDTQAQEAEHMSDKDKPEAFTVKAEEFAALQAKAAQVDELKKQAETFAAQLTETQTKLAKTQRERDLDRMVTHADQFVAIPGKAEEIGEKLLQLQEKDPELFKWVDGLLQTLDKQLAQGELFAQRTSDRQADGAETLEVFAEKILKETFKGDREHYVEALKMAETQRPDLAKAYYKMDRGG